MAYLSELVKREVRDTKGNLLGVLVDLLIGPEGEGEHYPRVVALAIKRNGGEPSLLPWEGAEDLAGNKIILQRLPAAPYQLKGHEVYLARDVLDKQVIDTNGFRVVRVNDLELARIGNDYRLVNVDVGGRGLLRRLGWEDVSERFVNLLQRDLPSRSIAWTDLGFIPRGDLKVRVPRAKLKELHSADIAEILEDMSPREVGEVIRELSDEKVADVIEELEPEFQADVLETFPNERAADIVEEMEPDAAADALQEMQEDRREQVLNLMEPEEKAEVKELLVHPEDTAGGLMTTKYITVPPGITVADALRLLRQEAAAKEAETIYYVYILDAEEHLVGVVSLSDLVLASPESQVDDIMHRRPIRLPLDASHEEALEAIAKYNLLAVPVVDSENRLQGIVTSEDALDLILPDEWKIKLPRLFR
ncbi:Magnesium transporter MgtE [Gammaproteobacteria bacterium]|nr:Magnesium transporter MgtE [Gammaproteobacteria bacterium]